MPFFLIMQKQQQLEHILQEAVSLCRMGNLSAAKDIYSNVLKEFPRHPEVLTNLGTIELQIGDKFAGIKLLEKSLSINPNQTQALSNLGNGLIEVKDYKEAIKFFNKSINLDIKNIDAFYNRGRVHTLLELYDEALMDFNQAIKLNPTFILPYISRSSILKLKKDYLNAEKDLNLAISINPEFVEAFNNRGLLYKELKLFDNALKDFDRAIELDPAYAEGFLNRGTLFNDLKAYDKALEDYGRAINLNPKLSEAYLNSSIIYLSKKRFEIGWDYYQKRTEVQKTKSNFLQNNTQPELLSPNIKAKTILIFAEQGLGDQILYLTMLSELNSKDNQIIVMLNERLIEIYKRSFANIKFISKNYNLEKLHYDYYILSGSLGKLFRPNINSFSSQVSGYLRPDKDKAKQLKSMLFEKHQKICGISWKSQNQEIGVKKSIDLTDFYKILKIQNIKFINLQYGDTSEEIQNLKDLYNIEIHKVNEIDNYSDLDGLSSLIDACDFVVTTSNVTAHIAGGIGKETFLIVPYSQGKMWYWHEGDVKNLWYPTVTQYSINKDQDAKITINEIASDIERIYL